MDAERDGAGHAFEPPAAAIAGTRDAAGRSRRTADPGWSRPPRRWRLPPIGLSLLLVASGCVSSPPPRPSGHTSIDSALQDALENNESGEVVEWWNLSTGDRGTVTPVRTFISAAGLPCREYRVMAVRGGADSEFWRAVACRDTDGRWKDGG